MYRRSLVVLLTFVLLASAVSAASPQRDYRFDDGMPASVARAFSNTPEAGGQVYWGYPHYYDPFYWGPYWGPYYAYDWRPQLRVKVRPEEPGDDAAIYIDGARAGVGDDFDGVDQGIGFEEGPHTVVVFLEGYRTQKFDVYLREGETTKLRVALQPLGPGELSERPEMLFERRNPNPNRSSESGRRYR
jgi:hypothetical protein